MISYKTFERNYKLSKIFDNTSYIDPTYKDLIDALIDMSENGYVIKSGIDIETDTPHIMYSYVYNSVEGFYYYKSESGRAFIDTAHIMTRFFPNYEIPNYEVSGFIMDFIVNFIDYDEKEKQLK